MCGEGCGELREEFRRQKFGLDHALPQLFVIPQCLRAKFYIFWVVFWALFYVSTLTLEVVFNPDDGGKYFIYLTNWSYLLQALFVYVDLAVTLYVHIRRKDIIRGEVDSTPWYMKVQWVLYNINIVVAPLVTLLYYGLLSPVFTHGSIDTHLLNMVYALLSVIFCAKPVQLLHVYQPMVYATAYTIFTLIWHFTDNEPVYNILDWDKSGSTTTTLVLVIFIGMPVMHVLMFALYTFRIWISEKCACTGSIEQRASKLTKEPPMPMESESTVETRNRLPPLRIGQSRVSPDPESNKF